MALFKVCSRTVTQRIVANRVIAPAFLTIRRNFGIKDTLDKYRDSSNAAFEEGIDTIERESKKLLKQPQVDKLGYSKADYKEAEVEFKKVEWSEAKMIELREQKKKKLDVNFSDDTIADAKNYIDTKLTPGETEEFDIYMGPMDTKPDMTIEEAHEVGEEVYRSWPNDHSIDETLPFAEKVKAADLDGSYGPAKAEYDSWKRIYKEEESFERLGLPPRAHYWRDGEMYSPYGTLSNPVKIYSQFSHRIVGCHGGNGVPHEIVWINLGNKYKTMCPECGQMFMLVNFHPKEHEEPGEDLHEISRTQNDGHLKEPQLY